MIEWLDIKNLALVEKTEVEFAPGFNVITGETGAGKTVIMSALTLLLGGRAGKNLVRKNTGKCEISVSLRISGGAAAKVAELLAEVGIDFSPDSPLLLRRSITESTSRNYVNDTPVALRTLSALGDVLIDVHGPHEHQSLLKNSIQLDILDDFGSLSGERAKVAELHQKLVETEQALNDFGSKLPSNAEAEHLRFLLNEIRSVNPEPDEDAVITERHKLAANAKEVMETIVNSAEILDESDSSVINQLMELRRELGSLERLGLRNSEDFLTACDALINSTRELTMDLDGLSDGVDLDEADFNRLEERLTALQTLKRKYGPTLSDVLATAEDAERKLDDLANQAERAKELERAVESAGKKHLAVCRTLSKKRRAVSARFADAVTAELKKLGFLKAGFSVEFNPRPPSPSGIDAVEWMFAANPGESSNPLKEVASGGEISRVMLALKTVLAESDSVPILVFDEIDVNIGGETAAVVGRELRGLGEKHQLICISHLPQVAAAADSHFKVEKEVRKKRTCTEITLLDHAKRQAELARMLGGDKAAAKHAAELLKNF
ncbi:MAG: DNA repair protein RecN [Kiritimatiellaeota bacterium]|nr:DNA repair protein RecN [Kiritimatiellota bacterium]